MSKRNILKISLGDVGIMAKETPMPPSDDATECYCAHCRIIGNMVFVLDITQNGFFSDKSISVMWCRHCGGYSFVNYDIEHDMIDLGD